MEKDKENFDLKSAINATTVNVEKETINRLGSAAKEHIVAYSGVDNETGKVLNRSLKDISNSKINPKYEQQNYRQQAGFSAEIKETARENAERIKEGKSTRVTRTDDIGRVNDPLYDHVELDEYGNIIEGSGSQMKFVGKNPNECLNKLMSEKYQKYRDNNVAFEVHSDYYDDIQQKIDTKVDKLEQQKKVAQSCGDSRLANKHQKEIDELKKVKKNMKKSHVSNKEAMEARKSPRLSTARDIHKLSHEAGIEGAKSGALIGGGVATVTNIVAMIDGKKDFDEAVKDITKTTGKSAITGYAATYGSTALKATMQNSSLSMARSLSNTGLPGAIVSTAISSVSALGDFFNGKIDGVELLTRVGKNGMATVTSMAYGAVGQVLIPIPVAGAIVGSFVGYTLTTMIYGGLMKAMNEAKLAREERIRIEKECNEAIQLMKIYRQEINKWVNSYLKNYNSIFDNAFANIKSALLIKDMDGIIKGFNDITRNLGGEVQFDTMEEFELLMNSDAPIKL